MQARVQGDRLVRLVAPAAEEVAAVQVHDDAVVGRQVELVLRLLVDLDEAVPGDREVLLPLTRTGQLPGVGVEGRVLLHPGDVVELLAAAVAASQAEHERRERPAELARPRHGLAVRRGHRLVQVGRQDRRGLAVAEEFVELRRGAGRLEGAAQHGDGGDHLALRVGLELLPAPRELLAREQLGQAPARVHQRHRDRLGVVLLQALQQHGHRPPVAQPGQQVHRLPRDGVGLVVHRMPQVHQPDVTRRLQVGPRLPQLVGLRRAQLAGRLGGGQDRLRRGPDAEGQRRRLGDVRPGPPEVGLALAAVLAEADLDRVEARLELDRGAAFGGIRARQDGLAVQRDGDRVVGQGIEGVRARAGDLDFANPVDAEPFRPPAGEAEGGGIGEEHLSVEAFAGELGELVVGVVSTLEAGGLARHRRPVRAGPRDEVLPFRDDGQLHVVAKRHVPVGIADGLVERRGVAPAYLVEVARQQPGRVAAPELEVSVRSREGPHPVTSGLEPRSDPLPVLADEGEQGGGLRRLEPGDHLLDGPDDRQQVGRSVLLLLDDAADEHRQGVVVHDLQERLGRPRGGPDGPGAHRLPQVRLAQVPGVEELLLGHVDGRAGFSVQLLQVCRDPVGFPAALQDPVEGVLQLAGAGVVGELHLDLARQQQRLGELQVLLEGRDPGQFGVEGVFGRLGRRGRRGPGRGGGRLRRGRGGPGGRGRRLDRPRRRRRRRRRRGLLLASHGRQQDQRCQYRSRRARSHHAVVPNPWALPCCWSSSRPFGSIQHTAITRRRNLAQPSSPHQVQPAPPAEESVASVAGARMSRRRRPRKALAAGRGRDIAWSAA